MIPCLLCTVKYGIYYYCPYCGEGFCDECGTETPGLCTYCEEMMCQRCYDNKHEHSYWKREEHCWIEVEE